MQCKAEISDIISKCSYGGNRTPACMVVMLMDGRASKDVALLRKSLTDLYTKSPG